MVVGKKYRPGHTHEWDRCTSERGPAADLTRPSSFCLVRRDLHTVIT